jgi:hypothetical protein
MKITKEQLKAIIKEEIERALTEGHGDVGMHDMQDPMAKVARLYHTWKPTTPEGEQYHRELGDALGLMQEEKDDDWIQDAEEDIERRGTEGVCTGKNFGSEKCPPGSKRYNLAKTFRKMAKDRKKD